MTDTAATGSADEQRRLLDLAHHWIDIEPDEANRQILREEIAAEDFDQLASRFEAPLTFGTAGLRAEEGPGLARMNRVVVRRTAAGLADWGTNQLAQPVADGAQPAAPLKIVIGYDARRGSAAFAEDSAAVFTAAGVEALLMPVAAPTPLVAYAVRALSADIGVMVTASHNPATDNGYKVYVGGRLTAGTDPHGTGSQITSPVDAQIAAAIQVWHESETEPPLASSGWQLIPDDVRNDYLADTIGHLNGLAIADDLEAVKQARHSLRVVYTAMHGVGASLLSDAMLRAGFAAPFPVTEQIDPDPFFPTVAFPNPEEPGALDLAVSTADSLPDVDLIIANDPDADRLAVAARNEANEWDMFTGDQVGLLLGSYLGTVRSDNSPQVFGQSVVSGTQLARWARAHEVAHVETLTGFKWISRVPGLTFGYEEALGYCVFPDLVHDKDGISAALVLCDFAARLKSRTDAGPRTLREELTRLSDQLGATVNSQISVRIADPEQMTDLMSAVRATPPSALVGLPVTQFLDFADPDQAADQGVGTTNLVSLRASVSTDSGDTHARLMLRPSGTEPKIKCYLETTAPSADEAQALMDTLAEETQRLLDTLSTPRL